MKIIMGENLVYDASVQVGSHHYARLFSRENEVLWLSIPWNIFLYLRYGKKGERYKQWNQGKVYKKDNINVWCPFTFVPYRDNFPFKSIKNIDRMLKYTSPNLKKKLCKEDFQECDVLWLTDPRMMYLTEIVKYKKLVYRCVDDLSHFSGIPQNISEAEETLVKKADIVFATANTLKNRLEGYGKKIYSLPNAVDYKFFNDYNVEGKISKIDNLDNVVLYVGTIGEWFDCEFIKYCAEQRPDYNFVLIGPERTNVDILKNISNVHLLGKIPYSDVPLYMKKSDVGIIPFKFSKLVDAVNPLKIYEYFACDLPVVATKAYELEMMKSPAYLYNDYENGLKYIDEAILQNVSDNNLNDYAKNNSWEARYEYIKSLIV